MKLSVRERVIAAIAQRPSSAEFLAQLLNTPVSTIRAHIRALRKGNHIYIAGWERPERHPRYQAIHGLGNGQDVPEPEYTRGYSRSDKERATRAAWTARCKIPLTHAVPIGVRIWTI